MAKVEVSRFRVLGCTVDDFGSGDYFSLQSPGLRNKPLAATRIVIPTILLTYGAWYYTAHIFNWPGGGIHYFGGLDDMAWGSRLQDSEILSL